MWLKHRYALPKNAWVTIVAIIADAVASFNLAFAIGEGIQWALDAIGHPFAGTRDITATRTRIARIVDREPVMALSTRWHASTLMRVCSPPVSAQAAVFTGHAIFSSPAYIAIRAVCLGFRADRTGSARDTLSPWVSI